MTKYLLLLGICLTCLTWLFGQTANPNQLLIEQDYNGATFPSFIEKMDEAYGLQFFYFSGWVKDLQVRQQKTPAELTEILEWTFSGTEYQYFINSQGQIILTVGATIQPKIKWKTKIDDSIEKTEEEISDLVNSSLEKTIRRLFSRLVCYWKSRFAGAKTQSQIEWNGKKRRHRRTS